MTASAWGATPTERRGRSTAAIVAAIHAADPAVPESMIHLLLGRRAKDSKTRMRLAEELRDHPDRLTHDDPRTQAPLAWLASDLRREGFTTFIQPTCPLCSRLRAYGYPREDGTRICRSCHQEPTEPCGNCGRNRTVATRMPDGSSRCRTCYSRTVRKQEPCTECGRLQVVAKRTLDGGPLCPRCYKASTFPDRTGRWIGSANTRRSARTAAIIGVLRPAVDGRLNDEELAEIIHGVGGSPQRLSLLANWLLDHPDGLTSGDTNAPKVVVSLLEELITRGVPGVNRPACARCQASDLELFYRSRQGRICARCYARARTDVCAACGTRSPINSRTADGAPLCRRCTPPHLVTCADCGRTQKRAATRNGQPLCSTCKARDVSFHEPCGICGRTRRAIGRTDVGQAVCGACYARAHTSPCTQCGAERTVNTRIDGNPYCSKCSPGLLRSCSICGHQRSCLRVKVPESTRRFGDDITIRVCPDCLLEQELKALLSRDAAGPDPHWDPLIDLLLQHPNPTQPLLWLRERMAPRLLHHLAQQPDPPTHADLDGLASTHLQSAEQVRALLEVSGMLSATDTRRDRFLQRAEMRITRDAPKEAAKVLTAYVRWSLLPTLERRANQHNKQIPAKSIDRVSVCIAYLSSLQRSRLTLEHANQHHLDRWLTKHPDHRPALHRFLTWTARNGHSPALVISSRSRPDPSLFLSPENRRSLIEIALSGSDPKWLLREQVAALLVLLYGQTPSQVVTLTRNDIIDQPDGSTALKLGRDPVVLPKAVAELIRQLPTGRVALEASPTRWLFPGRKPGHHLVAAVLARRLKHLGVSTRAARNTTLLELSRAAPPSVLADLLGLHVTTIDYWSNASGGRWDPYVAARRTPRREDDLSEPSD